MRLVTFKHEDSSCLGILQEDRVYAVADLLADAYTPLPDWAQTMEAFIVADSVAQTAIKRALPSASVDIVYQLPSVRLQAPLPRPRKNVFCVGLNYREHVLEGAEVVNRSAEEPAFPTFFSKPPTAVIGPEDDIVLDPSVTQELDYEIELGVVIGRAGKNIPESRALDYVFGYTIVNDISARDLQRRHGQWFKGKALDTACPLGPCIVTASNVADPQTLDLELRLNGRVMQSASTAQMIFPVAHLISELSHGMTLEPGDILATGTPAGVGFARRQPVFLQPGDLLEAEIKGIGILRNRVVSV